MLGRITLKLPIVRGGGVFIKLKKSVSFEFTRRAMWLFMERHDELEYDVDKFTEYKTNNKQTFVIEYMYFAHCAWCMRELKKPINEKRFFESVGSWSKKDIESILKCWTDADKIGFKSISSDSKKKVDTHY